MLASYESQRGSEHLRIRILDQWTVFIEHTHRENDWKKEVKIVNGTWRCIEWKECAQNALRSIAIFHKLSFQATFKPNSYDTESGCAQEKNQPGKYKMLDFEKESSAFLKKKN